MSAPRAIAELVVSSIRIFGKAMAAAGRQAAANARHKPEGSPDSAPAGGKGKSAITSQLAMSVEEAHLILNVKKEESMEKILENYERIFAANGPPPPPAEPAEGTPQAAAAAARAKAKPKTKKGPTHSHYLQSKVYRALERIKAERAEELAAGEAEAGAAAGEGAAAGAAEAAPAEAPKAGEQPKQQ